MFFLFSASESVTTLQHFLGHSLSSSLSNNCKPTIRVLVALAKHDKYNSSRRYFCGSRAKRPGPYEADHLTNAQNVKVDQLNYRTCSGDSGGDLLFSTYLLLLFLLTRFVLFFLLDQNQRSVSQSLEIANLPPPLPPRPPHPTLLLLPLHSPRLLHIPRPPLRKLRPPKLL